MSRTKYSKVRKLLTTDQGIGVYVGEEELVCCHHGAFTLQTVEPAGRRDTDTGWDWLTLTCHISGLAGRRNNQRNKSWRAEVR